MKRNLTDRALKALKPADAHYDVMDSVVPGFGIRVGKEARTFILIARYPSNPKHPTRRAIGKYGAIDLAGARQRARDWLELIRQGKDPQQEQADQRAGEARQRANTFAVVAADFIRDKLPSERKGKEVERDINRDLIPAWGALPITGLSALDIRRLINTKKATAPAQARNLLGIVKRLLSWAVEAGEYGLTASPADRLKPSRIIGEKRKRDRVLSDRELIALWRATEKIGEPYGSIYRLLMFSGLRLNEAADAAKPEFEFDNGIWVIPAARMKGKESKARAHAVPLTPDILDIFKQRPEPTDGNFYFSTDAAKGASPVWVNDKIKKRMDELMLTELRDMARERGEDPTKIELPHWINHDIRRTVRSQLSRLKVSEEAREAVLAHARPGTKGTYDQHDYLDEKREALTLWAGRLRSIVAPMAANVVELKRAG
jgi:integrase